MRLFKPLVIAASAALIAAPVAGAADGPPRLSSEEAVLVDGTDGHVLYKQDADTRAQIASTTKLMTALLALDRLPLDKELAATNYKPTSTDESLANLRPGERMKVADLLRALLLESANDAAVTLARGAGGSQEHFVKLMNRKAKQLGLKNTHFENPIGLDSSENYSTTRDLAKLTRAAQKNDFFSDTVKMPSARLLSGAYPRTIQNRNDLVGKYSWITGVKTGHTNKAGYALVGSATRNGAKLISVVLGEPSESSRNADSLALLDYGASLYRRVTPVRAGATVDTASIKYFDDKANLTAASTITFAARKTQRVRTIVDAPKQLEGPIAKGDRVGTIRILVGGRQREKVALVTAGEVPEASIFRKAAHFLLRPWLLALIAAACAFLVFRRRRKQKAAEEARQRRRRAAKLE